ncbi:MAG TPA: TRAP transporter small permease subunit [Burkholderiales bacterium]|nr:TRAP transporter small permease subunit [Burkholderiales bacterium]
MDRLLATSRSIERLLHAIAMAAGWLFIVCTVVIVFDVLTRKFGFQIPGMGSTRLQELEWHLHTALFSFWLGTAYLKNAHVRIDIAVANTPPRRLAWIELFGLLAFAVPYCLVAIYFSYDFFHTAWKFNEYSDSATGLPWRWIPKGIISIGLILLLAAVVAVGLRLVVYLWGPARLRAEAAFPSARS